jgi:RHS repeat-associated protein
MSIARSKMADYFRIIAIFVALVVGLRLVVPVPVAAFCPGCALAIVIPVNGDGSAIPGVFGWRDPSTDCGYTNPPPLVVGPCPIDIYAGASIDSICIDPPHGGTVFGSASVSGGSPGWAETVSSGNGWTHYRLHPPDDPDKLPVTFTVKATVTGPVSPDNMTNDCTTMTFTAVGKITFKKGAPCTSTCGAGSSSTPSLGTYSADNSSVDFTLNLGASSPQYNAGILWLDAAVPSTNLSQPSLLQVPWLMPNVDIVTNTNGVIEQVDVPQGLINVSTISSYEYQLQCFYATNVTAKTNGLYGTNGPAYCIFDILNPDGTTNDNRLWITEERAGTNRQFQYTYVSTNSEWDLLKPDGQTLSTWSVVNPGDSTITNSYRRVTMGGQTVSQTQRTYKYISGIARALMTQQLEGAGSETRTNTYSYYTNGVSSNLLQQVTYAEGNWVYYDYDAYGRVTTNYSAYMNSAPPTSGEPNPLVNHCKVTQYTYLADPTGGTDFDPAYSPGPTVVPYTTVISIPVQGSGGTWSLQEVSRTYHWSDAGTDEIQQCPGPGAAWDDSGNLVTTTTTSTAGDFTAGRPLSIVHPDGTTTTFSYPDQYTTIETDPDGSQTTNVTDAWGNELSLTKIDTTTGIVLSSVIYTYTNSSGNYFDPLRRSFIVTDLAGRQTSYTYDCCNLENVTDPDGVVTTYDYDILKRRIASTVYLGTNAITTTNALDALGRPLVTQRIGTDLSTITQQQIQYDVLGNVIAQTNALGGVTSGTNVVVGNQLCITNVNPDGGTSIQQNYRDGRLQSVTGTAVHPKQYAFGIEQDGTGGPWREFTLTTELAADSTTTSNWTKTYVDGAGRQYKTIYAAASTPYPSQQDYYNDEGHLWKSVDPDGVTALYIYDDASGDINQSQLQYTIVALSSIALSITDYDTLVSSLGTLENGIDRITRVQRSVVPAAGGMPNLVKTDTYAWKDGETDGNGTPVSSGAVSTDSLKNWSTIWNNSTGVSNVSHTVYGSTGYRYSTNTASDGSYFASTYQYGQLLSVTRKDANGVQLSQTTYGYDSHGRQNLIRDARNGTSTNYFNNADQVSGMATPVPGSGQSSQVTSNVFDTMSRIIVVQQPDNSRVTNIFNQAGNVVQTYGSRIYAAGYGYDAQSRKTTMTNWTTSATGAGARVTTWNYDQYRGFLTNKVYDGNNPGPSYTYTPAGRLLTRHWARGVTTTNTYNGAGELSGTTYSDGATPALGYGFDRRGRQISITNGIVVCSRTYNDAGNLLTESWSGGPQDGISVTNGYDSLLRRTNLVVLNPSNVLYSVSYGFDPASRIFTVSDGTNTAGYSYLANSRLVSQISFTNNGALRMTTTKNWDYLNRLLSNVSSNASGVVLDSHAYAYNSANQRTSVTNADASVWTCGYDPIGQAISGVKRFSDGTPVAGEQFGYSIDDIGNRTATAAGGDEWGANLRYATYSANNLNQYTSRTVPGAVDVIGEATNAATVTVNNQATYRHGTFYRDQLALNNSATPVWQSVTNLAVLNQGTNADITSTNSGNVFLPQTLENFTYDADGNLTSDGRWTNTWDAENRLISMQSLTNGPAGSKLKLLFAYDYMSRRTSKTVSNWTGSAWALTTNLNLVNDGWNLIATLNSQSSILQTFMWGIDLSGSMQGAGGVGGLLKESYVGTATTNCFFAFDGNGNAVSLLNAADATLVAQYDYGPFGELIRATGPMVKANPFRFSTKYQDDETDLLYYGYRYYSASTGRWLSKDPISDPGFVGIIPGTAIPLDPEEELLLQRGLQSLNLKDKVSLNIWLLELAARKAAGLKPYNRSIFDNPPDSNPYIFVSNDPNGHFDYEGLFKIPTPTIPYSGPPCVKICGCPFPIMVAWCIGAKKVHTWFPRHPVLLYQCLYDDEIAMAAACATCNPLLYRAACKHMPNCFDWFW